jgi:hypothetical protein
MLQLNTCADVKRALATASALEMVSHVTPDIPWNSPSGRAPIGEVRPITRRQSAAWAVRHTRRDGTVGDSWLRIDRASDVRANGDDTFSTRSATYRVHP